MTKDKFGRFDLLPWTYGMKGKTRARAKAEYYYEGEELEYKLLEIDFDDKNDSDYLEKKAKLDNKYKKINDEELAYELLKITKIKHDWDDEEKDYLLKKNELDFKFKKIKRRDYDKIRSTLNNESWVEVISEFNPVEGLSGLAVELDWNEIFVKELKEHGYVGLSDEVLVQQWFAQVCRTVAEEEGIMEEIFPIPGGGGTGPLVAGPIVKKTELDNGNEEYS